LAEARRWPALVIEAAGAGQDELIAAVLDDFAPAAIEDLVIQPIPPGGLWDPTVEPLPEIPAGPLQWRVYFNTRDARDAAVAALHGQFPDASIAAVDVPDADWAARSQRSLTAIQAGAFIVAPPWDLPDASATGTTTIVIEPSRGFGTGHHASTRLCLRALSDIDVSGARVLDLGTGSGVLAMAAALKGALEVVAVDVDADAIEAARESAALNDLPVAIQFLISDFRDGRNTESTGCNLAPPYDLVLANLTGGMLTMAAARIECLIRSGGRLIISGFDETERERVRAAFATLREEVSIVEEGWVGVVLIRL
jgi:ribosomal protein L11 methyltransferase